MKVIKFGGSSLANGESVQKAINIITSDPERQVVVVSAPGKRFPEDTKVTDLLIKYANAVINHQDTAKIVNEIFNRYREIGEYFHIPTDKLKPLKDRLLALKTTYPNDEYLLAAFKAHGERLNAQLIAVILNKLNHHARFVTPTEAGITVTGTPNNASVVPKTYDALDRFKINKNEILIFPGFYGITLAGHIATFSRGGSDITGAILARGLHAKSYENFTDVDAIYSANPQVVDNPKPITKMSYREMRELSYAGFSVFHDEALIPVIQGNIPIHVKNTNNPEMPGTLIVPDKDLKPNNIVTGVVSGKHFAALYLHKYLLNKQTGFTLRILQILAKYHVSYEHMPSGIDDITIIMDRNKVNDQLIDKISNEIQEEVNPDRLEWINNYAIIMVVGEGMRDKTGVSNNVLTSLAAKNIPVTMINQGASRISMMLGTYDDDADESVRAIYQRFFN